MSPAALETRSPTPQSCSPTSLAAVVSAPIAVPDAEVGEVARAADDVKAWWARDESPRGVGADDKTEIVIGNRRLGIGAIDVDRVPFGQSQTSAPMVRGRRCQRSNCRSRSSR